ncbi:hypothetical protein FCOIX_13123 [Fusarium coicis]|nr:hypothetical protein FCOIX_13123 [Fusarium coicis]
MSKGDERWHWRAANLKARCRLASHCSKASRWPRIVVPGLSAGSIAFDGDPEFGMGDGDVLAAGERSSICRKGHGCVQACINEPVTPLAREKSVNAPFQHNTHSAGDQKSNPVTAPTGNLFDSRNKAGKIKRPGPRVTAGGR